MIEDLFIGIIFAVIGLAVAVATWKIAMPRARSRQELARRKAELANADELEQFIRRVDQVTSADELDHLEEKKRDE